jgi:hypothetical protein
MEIGILPVIAKDCISPAITGAIAIVPFMNELWIVPRMDGTMTTAEVISVAIMPSD